MSKYFGGSATGGKGGMFQGAKASTGKGIDKEMFGTGTPTNDYNQVLIRLGIIWLIWKACC